MTGLRTRGSESASLGGGPGLVLPFLCLLRVSGPLREGGPYPAGHSAELGAHRCLDSNPTEQVSCLSRRVLY